VQLHLRKKYGTGSGSDRLQLSASFSKRVQGNISTNSMLFFSPSAVATAPGSVFLFAQIKFHFKPESTK
jgi:hypothetical protein